MSERWLRLYAGVVHDPKMQRLPAETFRCLINIWCIASEHQGDIPAIDALAFILRKPVTRVKAMVDELRQAGLLEDDGNNIRPHNWDGRQFQSDVSTSRVKQHRNRRKAVSGNGQETFHETKETFHETPPEQSRTETETETEQRESAPDGAHPFPKVSSRGTRLSESWQPLPENLADAKSRGMPESKIAGEAERFRDYWIAKAGKDGVKLDWNATWRTWVSRTCERAGYAPINQTPLEKAEAQRKRDWEGII